MLPVGTLEWGGKHDQHTLEADSSDAVVSHFMDRPRRDVLNTQVWGFIGACLLPGAALELYNALGSSAVCMVVGPSSAPSVMVPLFAWGASDMKSGWSTPSGSMISSRCPLALPSSRGFLTSMLMPADQGTTAMASGSLIYGGSRPRSRVSSTLLTVDSNTTVANYRGTVLSQAGVGPPSPSVRWAARRRRAQAGGHSTAWRTRRRRHRPHGRSRGSGI
jgi:hypothetical protein